MGKGGKRGLRERGRGPCFVGEGGAREMGKGVGYHARGGTVMCMVVMVGKVETSVCVHPFLRCGLSCMGRDSLMHGCFFFNMLCGVPQVCLHGLSRSVCGPDICVCMRWGVVHYAAHTENAAREPPAPCYQATSAKGSTREGLECAENRQKGRVDLFMQEGCRHSGHDPPSLMNSKPVLNS